MSRSVLAWLAEQVPKARHALVLTHNISFLFVQTILLPRFRAAGNPRITIFADASCATAAWNQDRGLVDGLGSRYRVVPGDVGPNPRVQPKALLLADQTRAALVLGSGNLTLGGMGSNREIWNFAVSDGEGAARISAFRDYLTGLIQSLPIAEPLRDAAEDIFDPENTWVLSLPPPAGLAIAPASVSILDQIAAGAGEVQSVTLLAPYFDDRGEALSEIARRFNAPVSVLLQPDRVGLWTEAAKRLPAQVKLKSVQDSDEHPAFIHAKMLALHRDEDVLLAVGSANCSRAALLSNLDEGNAEQMAFESTSPEALAALLDELEITDDPPELPAIRPSEDWPDDDRPPLRILAARQSGTELKIAFKSDGPVADFSVICEGLWPAQRLDLERRVAVIAMPLQARAVAIQATAVDGSRVTSAEAWVDDEASLTAPSTRRRLFAKLAEAEEPESDPARGYQGILEVFNEYLRDPQAARRKVRRRDDAPDAPPARYDPAAVFADDFGRAGLPATPGTQDSIDMPFSALAIIESLFATTGEVAPRRPTQEPDDGEPLDPEAETKKLISRRRPTRDGRSSAALRRAVESIEGALLDPAFLDARAPRVLAEDLALVGVLLTMGLTAHDLDVSAFRATTRKLWGALFFGEGARGGAIPARISASPAGPVRDAFVADLASPILAATLTIWFAPEWQATDAESAWFSPFGSIAPSA